MCRFGDETVELLRATTQRARKPYTCNECHRTIGVGEQYVYEAWKWEGDFDTAHTCTQCVQVRRWLERVCDGWNYTEIEEDLFEHVTGYEKHLRTRPLTRLARWMRADWRDRAGNLRPVEAVQAVTDEAIAAWLDQLDKAVA